MSTTPNTNGGDAPQTTSTFSYAQAAKGKVLSSASSPAGKPESFSWADDSADTVTVTEDTYSSSKSHVSSSKSSEKEQSLSRPPVTDDKAESLHSTSSDFVVVSSPSTANQADMVAEPKTPSENTWESKSQSSSGIAPARSVNEERGRSKGTASKEINTEESEEKVPEKPLKEAPIPTVNFWQQRAQEAKARQGSISNQTKAPATLSESQLSRGATTGLTSSQNSTAKSPTKTLHNFPMASSVPRREVMDRSEGEDARSAGPAASQGSKVSRVHKAESTGTEANALAPVRDMISWPTPVSAQDEDRRKAQEKGEKVEKERTITSAPKPHGKNEWKPVPITPSVKFNTPLPTSRGRGGRLGSRGGRGGGYSDRASVPVPSTSNDESLSDNKTKDGSATVPVRSPTEPSTSRQPIGSKSPHNGVTATEFLQPKDNASKLDNGNEIKLQGVPLELSINQEHIAQSFSEQEPPKTAMDVPSSGDGKMKSDLIVSDNPTVRRRGTAQHDIGSVVEGSSLPRQKRRGSQTVAREGIDSESKDRRRSMMENGAAADRSSWTETKFDTNQNRERGGNRESWTAASHRERGEGRPERGRGGWKSGRGNHPQAPHYGPNQNNNGSNVPLTSTGQTSTHSKGSPSYSQPYSQSATFTPNPRGGYRNNPRASTSNIETSFNRYPSGPPNGYPYAFNGYMAGIYENSGMTPMTPLAYNPFIVVDPGLFHEIATQLTYYFSLENMIKDLFLRKHMDSQGFVSLTLIANFKRMKDLTTDLDLIKFICQQSEDFEMRVGLDGKDWIRKRGDWTKWVLAIEERDSSAQNAGPSEIGSGVSTAFQSAFVNPMQHYMGSTSGFQGQGRDNSHLPFSVNASSFSPLPINPLANGFHSPSPTLNGTHMNGSYIDAKEFRPSASSTVRQETLSPTVWEHGSPAEDQKQSLETVVRSPASGSSANVVTPLEGATNMINHGKPKISEHDIPLDRDSRSHLRQDEDAAGYPNGIHSGNQ